MSLVACKKVSLVGCFSGCLVGSHKESSMRSSIG